MKILLFSLFTATSHSMAYSILEKLRLADRFLHAPLGNVQNHTIGEIKTVMVDLGKTAETHRYLLTSHNRLAVGDALKRVSLGYFQQVNTGSILSSVTTGLTTLETMGIRMIDNFVGGYLNFLVIFLFLLIVGPLTALIALAAAALSFRCMKSDKER